MNYTYGYDYGSSYGALLSNPIYLGIEIAITVFSLICMWIIFKKAGKPGWAILIPIYNVYVLFEITWGKGVKFLLLLIPIANLVIAIMTIFKLAKVFGKGGGFGCGLLFLNPIFEGILAFGSARYVGIPGVYPGSGYGNPYAGQGYQNPYSQGYQNPYSQNQANPYAQPQQNYSQPQQNYAQPQQTQWQPAAAPQAPQVPPAPQPQSAPQVCPYCGTPLTPGASFCTACGAKVN